MLPCYRTDHNMISLCFPNSEPHRGPGLWKFYESLLGDENYVEIVIKCINQTLEQHCIPVYSYEFLCNSCNYKDIQFKISDNFL